MNRVYWASSIGLLGLAIAATAARTARGPSSPPVAPTERVPVVVELFTSEGCSSCPPADDALTKLASTQPVPGAEIIALGEHVDYWDRLGWRDPFSSAAFSARQSEYAAKAFHSGNIYTPQMVVNGREEFVGSDYRAATSAIARAVRPVRTALRISLEVERSPSGASASVLARVDVPEGTSLTGAADVFLAVTEDGLVTKVQRGENGGRLLRHSAVVRSLTRVGTVPTGSEPWSATSTLRLSSDWNLDRSRIVAFAQDQATRKILGAAAVNVTAKSPI